MLNVGFPVVSRSVVPANKQVWLLDGYAVAEIQGHHSTLRVGKAVHPLLSNSEPDGTRTGNRGAVHRQMCPEPDPLNQVRSAWVGTSNRRPTRMDGISPRRMAS